MKKYLNMLAMIIALACFMATLGCATTPKISEETSYATLDTFADIYDSTMKLSAEMVANDDMSLETYDKIAVVANQYRESGRVATKAMRAYTEALTGDPNTAIELKEVAKAALSALGETYKDLFNLVKVYGLDKKIPVLQLINL